AEGVDWAVVAGGERGERLRRDGIILNGRPIDLGGRVREAPGAGWEDGADLGVVAVKTGALAAAGEALRGWLRADGRTAVLPLQNGIGATGALKESLGAGRAAVLRGFVLCNSAVRNGNAVTQEGTFRVRLAGPPAEAAERALAVLRASGIEVDIPEDMQSAQWEKWILNVGLNQTEALLGLTHGELLSNGDASAFMWTLVDEGVALAKAVGVAGAEGMPGRIREALRMLTPGGKSSMLQDVEAGRATEVEAFAGTLCRMARARGLPSPANALVLERLGGGGESGLAGRGGIW
ncbi:MAG: 2-dehydropantoate 2-reductase, partial [Kiritimatiellae bacterium]|nr:2-dehydropantoate 2-reductase [Kiritimatiellia bacterium]